MFTSWEYTVSWYRTPERVLWLLELRLNAKKTVATCFHLDNKQAARKLKVTLAGEVLVHDFAPKYLGVTLDRSLTYRKHTENVRDKVKSRCNIISKLAGTDWGAPAPVDPYFAHLLSPSYIRSQTIVRQYGEDVLMSSTLIRSLTSRCVPSQALIKTNQHQLTACA